MVEIIVATVASVACVLITVVLNFVNRKKGNVTAHLNQLRNNLNAKVVKIHPTDHEIEILYKFREGIRLDAAECSILRDLALRVILANEGLPVVNQLCYSLVEVLLRNLTTQNFRKLNTFLGKGIMEALDIFIE